MFKKSKIFILATLVFLCMSGSLPVSAMEASSYNTVYATDINVVDLDIPDYNESKAEVTNDINNTPTTYSIDESKEVLNVLPQLRNRSAYLFEDNPNASASGTLTESNDMDFYFFSITDASKFLLAQLTSNNAEYVAQLYIVDDETGDATATNVYGFAGDLIQLNGLPVGEYAFVIFF